MTPLELENKCNDMREKLDAYCQAKGIMPLRMRKITNGQVVFTDMMTAEQYIVYLTPEKEPTWGILH